jgi:hypothetical protein
VIAKVNRVSLNSCGKFKINSTMVTLKRAFPVAFAVILRTGAFAEQAKLSGDAALPLFNVYANVSHSGFPALVIFQTLLLCEWV